VQPHIAKAKNAVAARHIAWIAKVNADQEANALKGLHKARFSVQEKAARLKGKHDADDLFNKTTHEATLTLNNLLLKRTPIIGAALTRLCNFYDDIFKLPPKQSNEPDEPAEEFASMTVAPEEPSHNWVRSAAQTCDSIEDPTDPQGTESVRALDSIKDPEIPQGTNSTVDTTIPTSVESNHDSDFSDDFTNSQDIDNNYKEGCVDIVYQSKTDVIQKSPPLPPLFTMPREDNTIERKYLKGERVKVWSSSKKKWLEGIIKNIFHSKGSWDNYAIPAGVIQVESDIGVKFIRAESMNELRKSVSISL